jgi:hypothetical protein
MNVVRINVTDDALAALAKCKALVDGDRLEVGPGHYVNYHLGIKANDITVVGIHDDAGNRPWFQSVSPGLNNKGKPMLPPDFPSSWGGAWSGRGICVVKGDRVSISGIHFSGAKSNSFNGAGIRHEGTDLFVYDCELDHCENGILGSEKDDATTPENEGGTVWVEDNHFHHNGTGQAHNLYISRAALLVFFNNVSDSSIVGHLCKSRAAVNVIYRNTFADGDANPSYHVDVEGNKVFIVENTFDKTQAAANFACVIFYYIWHYTDKPGQLHVLRNRLINTINGTTSFVKVDERIETKVNRKTVYSGTGTINGKITENVAVFSDAKNAKGNPSPLTAGVTPWRVPATVSTDGNTVVPIGTEPPFKPFPSIKLTVKTLPYFIQVWEKA